MYWDHMTGWGWMMMVLWTILLLLVAGGLIWAILAATQSTSSTRRSSPTPQVHPSARDVLDERFARGEIDADEYQQRRRVLEEPLARV